MLIYFGYFLYGLRSRLFDNEDANIGSTYTMSVFTRCAFIEDACTKDAYIEGFGIGDTYDRDIYASDACTKSIYTRIIDFISIYIKTASIWTIYVGYTFVESTFIRSACYIRNAYV